MLRNLLNRGKDITIITILLVGMMLLSACRESQSTVENKALTSSSEPNITMSTTKEDDATQAEISEATNTAETSNTIEITEPTDTSSEVKEFSASEDMQLGKLKVDMTKSEIDKLMTAKISGSKIADEYGIETEILSYDDGTEIHLVGGKIYFISVITADYPTPRGLKVGDSSDTLKQLYGEPTAIEEDDRWIFSSRGYDLFFVTVKDGVVVKVMVSQVM
jgi:hypothetical protein